MTQTKVKKESIVNELADKLKRQKITIFTDFHGISVSGSHALRRELKKTGAEYKVSKKTLLDRALAEAGIGVKTKEMQGELGVAFGYEDEVGPAKTLLKFSKKNETFKILGGVIGDKIINDKDVIALAKLPSREVLIGQVVGAIAGPLRGLVTVLQGNMRNLVVVLNKIKESRN